jgi:hypothetical protein
MEKPEGSSTTLSTPSLLWVEEPKQRGTFGILSLCFSTLVICVWSTLHFNIPPRRHSATHRFLLQVFWMLIALLAPEFLLYIAITQRANAGILVKESTKYFPSRPTSKPRTRTSNHVLGQGSPEDVSTQK